MHLHTVIAGITGTALAMAGCYAPDVIDCTVTCTEPTDCAGDQVCTGGLCAAEGAVCHGGGATVDAALMTIALRVQLDGEGKVTVVGVGECTRATNNGVCTWQVAPARYQLTATPAEDREFDKWTTMNCAGQPSTCTLTPATATTVGAKFR